MADEAIRFKRVWKQFQLRERHESLYRFVSTAIRRVVGRRQSKAPTTFWALRDLDFSVRPGESLGIIGPNGAGKSTALKLLAGILHPDRGEISVRGRPTALIEVGAGFHGDLTGRENIFLNGAILGMSRPEIQCKLDSIVEFAGLERFLDMPVKRYSSGMYARLGFSIAAHVDPDVLLVDEVLSVGDAAFRLRCMERMRQLMEAGTTLIFVSHHLDQLQSICGRTLVLEEGRKTFDGPTTDAVGHYLKAVSRGLAPRGTDWSEDALDAPVGPIEAIDLRFCDLANEEVTAVRAGQPLRAELRFRLLRPVERLIVELNLRTAAQEGLLSFNSGRDGKFVRAAAGDHVVTLHLSAIPLAGGQYFWNVRMWDMAGGTTLADTPLRFPMVVDDGGRATGRFVVEHNWEVSREEKSKREEARGKRVAAGAVGSG